MNGNSSLDSKMDLLPVKAASQSNLKSIPCPRAEAPEKPRERSGMERRAEATRSERSDFERTYEEVARANEKAQTTGREVHKRPERCSDTGEKRKAPAERKHEVREDKQRPEKAQRDHENNSAKEAVAYTEETSAVDKSKESESTDEKKVRDDAGSIDILLNQLAGVGPNGELVTNAQDQAWFMVRQSLTVVSQTFNLNIVGDLETLQGTDPGEAVVKQFAEILQTLKAMTGMLENAISEDVDLEMQGETLDGPKMLSIEKTVRIEIFRLEMAFESLGVAGQVAEKVAEMNQEPAFMGIPVAVDPATLSMSEIQVKQVFGELIENSEEQIQKVVGRLLALAKEKSGGSAQVENGRSAEAFIPKLAGSQNQKPLELSFLGAQIMSRLTKGEVAVEGEAVQPVVDKAGNAGVGYQAGGLMQTMKLRANFQQTMQMTGDAIESVAQFDPKGQIQPQSVEFTPRIMGTPFRNMEESVMNQVMDRVQNALRTGTNEIRIQLRPESLGEVQLKIQIEGDVVIAKMNVESQQVKQIVESNLQQLRDALAEHNLQAGSFDVNVNKRFDQQTQDAIRNGRRSGPGGAAEEAEDAESEAMGITALKTETGKRYGRNSVEYFA